MRRLPWSVTEEVEKSDSNSGRSKRRKGTERGDQSLRGAEIEEGATNRPDTATTASGGRLRAWSGGRIKKGIPLLQPRKRRGGHGGSVASKRTSQRHGADTVAYHRNESTLRERCLIR